MRIVTPKRTHMKKVYIYFNPSPSLSREVNGVESIHLINTTPEEVREVCLNALKDYIKKSEVKDV